MLVMDGALNKAGKTLENCGSELVMGCESSAYGRCPHCFNCVVIPMVCNC